MHHSFFVQVYNLHSKLYTTKILTASIAVKLTGVGLVCSGVAFVTSKCIVDLMDGAINKSERILNNISWTREAVKKEY